MYSRRSFLHSASLTLLGAANSDWWPSSVFPGPQETPILDEFDYADVSLHSELHESQLHNTHDVLMNISEDSLLKPLRAMSGLPAPGAELDGWYRYDPHYDHKKNFDDGFAPACPFGQWISALARYYAITRDPATREKVLRLNRLYAQTISGQFYENNRFPAYCYDKFVLGLIDSHKYVHDPAVLAILEHTTDTALPYLPKTAIEHGVSWRPGTDESYTWDESYTISENLFLAYQRGAGSRYKQLGLQYLDDLYFDPLAEGRNNLSGRHAYSHVNSLSSAMQAYLTAGSEKHFRAAKNGFDMLVAQSYATGGWGPNETLRAPGTNDLADSLSNTHSSFETPCGAYAHFKITRYLLRVTREARYGDSMERVMYNTILGAKPLLPDGSTFYYSDYNFDGKKFYKPAHWPCCSGTMPQIAVDYRISTYFRDVAGVYVNLYIPSTLQWIQSSARISLKQTTNYPFDSDIHFKVQASQPKEFALRCRIPAWAEGATVSVNGKAWSPSPIAGSFVSMPRTWKSGDGIDLHLPMRTRLEPIDTNHPNMVALLYGPLVLFGIQANGKSITGDRLLAAKRLNPTTWEVESPSGAIALHPFTHITDEPYSTYFRLS